nr:unnamed protein product [Digitaria exilis]
MGTISVMPKPDNKGQRSLLKLPRHLRLLDPLKQGQEAYTTSDGLPSRSTPWPMEREHLPTLYDEGSWPIEDLYRINNPRFATSDGVPPDATIAVRPPVTDGQTPYDRRSDSLYRQSDSLSRSSDEEIPTTERSSAYQENLVFITDLLDPSLMESKIDRDDIPTNIEDLDEEGRQKYLVVLAHLQNEFLKGFKKDHDTVTRVQEFVMPSFKMSDNKIEPSGPVPLQAVRPAYTMVVQRR